MSELTEASVRAEVRAWLEASWNPELGLIEWRNKLIDSGWGVPTWPRQWYGRELPAGLAPVVEEEMQRMRDAMRELLQPAVRLTIVQRDDTVTFTDDQGRVRKFVANGKKEKHQLDAATLEATSRWKDGALVIEWKTGRGPTVVRTYRANAETRQLTVETTMKGGRGGPGGGDRPPVRHVYDAAEPLQN